MLRFFKLLFLFAAATGCLLFFSFLNAAAPALEIGEEYVYCLGSSSQGELLYLSRGAGFVKPLLGAIGGESSRYRDRERGEWEEKYQAELLFTEEAEGVTSFYYSSPCFPFCVLLNGKKVNLHIAERGNILCVGTPVIFGSF